VALIGSKAMVVGGSRGIGRAVAVELARQGADVALVYKSADAAARNVCEEIASLGRRGHAVRADISDPGTVDHAFATIRSEFGLPTMVVNTAGGQAPESYVYDQTPEEFWSFLSTDVYGAYSVVHGAIQMLREAGGGSIIAMSSIAVQSVPTRNSAGAASKAATEALIKVVAREEARHGIRANAVAIGLTDTEMFEASARKWGAATTDRIVKGVPLGRIGRPQEVADFVAYLLDERAAFITGKTFQIDGGQFIGG
jgi:3-oxoacyl-[acyl-carrier protein] reductase